MSYREVLLRSHLRAEQAASVIETLVEQRDRLRAQIKREQQMNDPEPRGSRICTSAERGYSDAVSWLEAQRAPSGPRA